MKKILKKQLPKIYVLTSLIMIIARFLLNEKGRLTPDSIRYMRQAHLLPIVDNTTAPLGYPFFIKLFGFGMIDEFWSSKLVGIVAYVCIIVFAWQKNFFTKETILTSGLFSFISIFSVTLSESIVLPIIFLIFYLSHNILLGKYSFIKGVFWLSLLLIIGYNIRYNTLFIMCGVFVFGVLSWRKKYAKIFIISSIIGIVFIGVYKILFIDYFNTDYIEHFLEIGLHPTSKLIKELFYGLTTTFNPFIHIANPNSNRGVINYGIYTVGFINIVFIFFLILYKKLSSTEQFILTISLVGIICSFLIQYFYSLDALDYRLLAPFSFGIWLIEFKKLLEIFGKWSYTITLLSFCSGIGFIYLTKVNFIDNKKEVEQFIEREQLTNTTITFYTDYKNLPEIEMAELISSINPMVRITTIPKDTLKGNVLTLYKVSKKIKIKENKFQ